MENNDFITYEKMKSLYTDKAISDNEASYLIQLYNAIANIKDYFVKSSTPFSNDEEEEKVENGINCELYRLFQNSIESSSNPLKLMVGPENRKHVSTNEERILNNFDIQPDFVVHHVDERYSCQLIVGEIKRRSALTIDKIAWDINKLLLCTNHEIWGGHEFSYPVFVVFSSNNAILKKKIKGFLENERELVFKNIDATESRTTLKRYLNEHCKEIKHIICFMWHKYNEVTFETLYDIINKE